MSRWSLFGTADPDAGVYALDANTGKTGLALPDLQPRSTGPADVGAGVTISPPGNNGFADGVAYVPSKDGKLYALNLTTGAEIWHYDFESFPPIGNGARDTACLDGDQVVFGSSVGVFDVNAVTGKQIWEDAYPTLPNEALGAPAIAGPPGEQVVYTTDVNGAFQVLSLATGKVLVPVPDQQLPRLLAGGGSGNVLFTAADGFLYDMDLGGGNTGTPDHGGHLARPRARWCPTPTPREPRQARHHHLGHRQRPARGQPASRWPSRRAGQTGPWWSNDDKAVAARALRQRGHAGHARGHHDHLDAQGPGAGRRARSSKSAPRPSTRTTWPTPARTSRRSTSARVDFTVSPSTTAPTLQLSAAPGRSRHPGDTDRRRLPAGREGGGDPAHPTR